MSTTKAIRVPVETYRMLRKQKKPYETWASFFSRTLPEPLPNVVVLHNPDGPDVICEDEGGNLP